MEPTYRFRADCVASTFSPDLFTRIETTNFRQLYRAIMTNLRYDHMDCRHTDMDRTKWEMFVDGTLAYTITYTSYCREDCDAYTIRIFRHHGKPNQKVCYYIVKEG